jgi:hypothetical protein
MENKKNYGHLILFNFLLTFLYKAYQELFYYSSERESESDSITKSS